MDDRTRETIVRIIRSCVYGQLATVASDGSSPSVRPVCAFLQDDLSILVPSHTATRKIEEIEKNPRVEICFVDGEHWQVRVRGHAEVVNDPDTRRHVMETTLEPRLWRGFFPDGPEDARFVLYRIRPSRFEWMKEWELRYRRVDLDPDPRAASP